MPSIRKRIEHGSGTGGGLFIICCRPHLPSVACIIVPTSSDDCVDDMENDQASAFGTARIVAAFGEASNESTGWSRARTVQPAQRSPQLPAKRRRVRKERSGIPTLVENAQSIDVASGENLRLPNFAPPPRHHRQPLPGSESAANPTTTALKEGLTLTNLCGDRIASLSAPGQLLAHEGRGSFDSPEGQPRLTPSSPYGNIGASADLISPREGATLVNSFSRPELLQGDAEQSQSKSIHVSPSLPSLVSRSIASLPFSSFAVPIDELTPALADVRAPAIPPNTLQVMILNGVSGEEEAEFSMPLEEYYSEQDFLSSLDRLTKEYVGQTLAGLNWLSPRAGGRFERCRCDLSMVEKLFKYLETDSGRPTSMLLCTVPMTPPSELLSGSVRLRGLVPDRVEASSRSASSQLRLDTSLLEDGHHYAVAFTNQWSNVTYATDAQLLSNRRGVVFHIPRQMFAASTSSTEGLYDVHLVMDGSVRSQNRRALTLAENDLSSSTSVSSFLPIRRAPSGLVSHPSFSA